MADLPADSGFNLLRRRGLQGIAGAAIILGILLVIVLLSKLNEVRHHRLPFMWRKRLRRMVLDGASHLKQADESNNIMLSYHHALTADSFLSAAKNMVGHQGISKITGLNVERLEADIEKWLHIGKDYIATDAVSSQPAKKKSNVDISNITEVPSMRQTNSVKKRKEDNKNDHPNKKTQPRFKLKDQEIV